MEILQSVSNSVLWLFESNEAAKRNLKKYANLHGINPSRIIFAKQMPLAEHLARHKLVDLFLDTLPYNAHTTASDSLWAGAPVLTQIGHSFASRVAASLNFATGLQDLIATTADEYKRLAIQLANNPDLLTSYRKKLLMEQKKQNLFDITQFCNDIENVYQEII
jgi:protein O-GlcNAc transferase